MPRSYDPANLVALPRLDANAAVALATEMEAAATDPKTGKRIKLPEAVDEEVDTLVADRDALKAAIGEAGGAPTPSGIRHADRREDRVSRAFHAVAEGWSLLAEEFALGEQAATLYDAVYGDEGIGFIQLPVRKEWAVVETKLDKIDRSPALQKTVVALGLQPMLDLYRGIHADYGKAIGVTQTPAVEESPAVREKLDALIATLRALVTAIAGSRRRTRPETFKLADRLLRPLTEFVDNARKAQGTTGGDGGKGEGGGTAKP